MKYFALSLLLFFSCRVLSSEINTSQDLDCKHPVVRSDRLFVSTPEEITSSYPKIINKSLINLYRQAAADTEKDLSSFNLDEIGNIFYSAQVNRVVEACSRKHEEFSMLEGSAYVENSISALIGVIGLRSLNETDVNRILPILPQKNLTTKVDYLILSYYCSESETPKIFAALSKVGIKCYKNKSLRHNSELIDKISR